MTKFKRVSFNIIITFIFACYFSSAIAEEIQFNSNDAYTLIDALLEISPEPTHIGEGLAQYKNWASVYAKYSKKNLLSKNELKIYLLIVFIAEKSAISHTEEEISKEVVAKFERQPDDFLAVLDDYRFLIPTTCGALKGHFIMTGELNKRHGFAEKHKRIIQKYLDDRWSVECLKNITEIAGY